MYLENKTYPVREILIEIPYLDANEYSSSEIMRREKSKLLRVEEYNGGDDAHYESYLSMFEENSIGDRCVMFSRIFSEFSFCEPQMPYKITRGGVVPMTKVKLTLPCIDFFLEIPYSGIGPECLFILNDVGIFLTGSQIDREDNLYYCRFVTDLYYTREENKNEKDNSK